MEHQKLVSHRFKDKNLVAYSFANRVLVKCPNCQNRAEVRTDRSTHLSTFHCPNCHHQPTFSNKRYDLSIKVNCATCANPISLRISRVATRKQAVRVKCNDCGDTQSYQPTYKESVAYGGGLAGSDRFLGLELWLQAQFRTHLFWAYNHEHLAYMEAYIAAKLRERQDRRYMTLVERLPDFVKSGKNREDLLKLVDKLKVK